MPVFNLKTLTLGGFRIPHSSKNVERDLCLQSNHSGFQNSHGLLMRRLALVFAVSSQSQICRSRHQVQALYSRLTRLEGRRGREQRSCGLMKFPSRRLSRLARVRGRYLFKPMNIIDTSMRSRPVEKHHSWVGVLAAVLCLGCKRLRGASGDGGMTLKQLQPTMDRGLNMVNKRIET
ncbi:uncharacterized protein BJX67DRAFT_334275 [Aspergillus lucknowensis]|uniref:Uncharacterized protein n=1 Tax=Aspergillus lucknowensis TaxID=176173 RepID=A0ABR4L928_9EURO